MLVWCYETHAHRILYEQVGRQQPQHVIIIAQLDKKGIMVAVRLVGCTVETHVNLAKRRFVFTTVAKGLLLRSCVLLCSLVFLIEKELEAVSCIFESQSKRTLSNLIIRERERAPIKKDMHGHPPEEILTYVMRHHLYTTRITIQILCGVIDSTH